MGVNTLFFTATSENFAMSVRFDAGGSTPAAPPTRPQDSYFPASRSGVWPKEVLDSRYGGGTCHPLQMQQHGGNNNRVQR